MHQGPCFYINNFRATTITIATATNNDLAQHEPAEKGPECLVSDHSSIGSGCAKACVRGGGYMWCMPMHLLSVWDGTHS